MLKISGNSKYQIHIGTALQPIHYAFGSVMFFITIVLLCCLTCFCYKRFPSLLNKLTCNLCCHNRLVARQQSLLDKQRLKVQARARIKFSELKTDDSVLKNTPSQNWINRRNGCFISTMLCTGAFMYILLASTHIFLMYLRVLFCMNFIKLFNFIISKYHKAIFKI